MDTNSRGTVRVEPSAKRVRAYLAGRLVADTRHPSLVWEVPYYPAYYVPVKDVTAELVATGKTEHSPSRGDALVYDVRVDGAAAEGAARQYPDSPLPAIRDLVRFEWAAMDEWLEEDEPAYTHPPARSYLPLPDVRTDLLTPSVTETHCPYKGTATYWSVDAGRGPRQDLVWAYRAPLPESQKIAGLAYFYDEKVDVYLDGELQERPRTHFA